MIKKYSDDASFNNLKYDRDGEEGMVKSVFQTAILQAGEILSSPYKMTENFLRFVHSHEAFKPYLDQGLAQTILSVEREVHLSIFETPQTVSWERVHSKLPRIYYDLIDVMEHEKRRFA